MCLKPATTIQPTCMCKQEATEQLKAFLKAGYVFLLIHSPLLHLFKVNIQLSMVVQLFVHIFQFTWHTHYFDFLTFIFCLQCSEGQTLIIK